MHGVSVQLSLVDADGMFSAPSGSWWRLCPDEWSAWPLVGPSCWQTQQAAYLRGVTDLVLAVLRGSDEG